jgi:hypothetical protein
VRIAPAEIERERIRSDLENIGGTWTERGKRGRLICYVWVPQDAFYSLCHSAFEGAFHEMVVWVKNLKRGRGEIEQLTLKPELTDLSEE